jgi:hypothetical protein
MHKAALTVSLFGALIGATILGGSASAAAHDVKPAVPAVSTTATPAAPYGVGLESNLPITMSDGTVLRADVRYPTDPKTGAPAAGPFGVILGETPYGKEFATSSTPSVRLLADYNPAFVPAGYISVIVDVRGTGASQGQWSVLQPQEALDSVQVINWAAKLPHSNGRVGMWGISYGGIDQLFAAAAVGPGSPLKAIFPMMISNDTYRELATTGGLLNVESDPAYLAQVTALDLANPALEGSGTPPGEAALVTQHLQATLTKTAPLLLNIMSGGTDAYDESYWQARAPRNILSKIVANNVPAYLLGGEFDVYQQGEPRDFSGLQNAWAGRSVAAPMTATQPVTGRYQEIFGPWYHLTAPPTLTTALSLQWFDRFLNQHNNGIDQTTTPLHVIDASGKSYSAARYPIDPAATRTYFLAGSGTMTNTVPPAGTDPIVFTGASQPCSRELDQFTIGVIQTGAADLGTNDPCGQSQPLPSSVPPGALNYETPPFSQTATLAGQAALTVYATANTRNTELIAHLFDVAPDGTATQLSYGALIGSQRAVDPASTWYAADGRPIMPWHPYTQASEKPVQPGAVERYDIELAPAFTTLAAGHRLRVTLTTGDTPHLIPTLNQLPDLIGGVYQVHRGAADASSLQLSFAENTSAPSATASARPPTSSAPASANTASNTTATGGGDLAFTGFDVLPTGLAALVMVGAGLALRRRR